MNTKTLSDRALSVIDQYLHFALADAVCSVPYFNNKTAGTRAALRVNIGKGSPREIREEIMAILKKSNRLGDALNADVNRITGMSGEALKMALVDSYVGVDCSAFAYYVLNAEMLAESKGPLDKRLQFINCHGLIGRVRCRLRPIENCDVATFAADANSRTISLAEAEPGDIITMIGGPDGNDRDHILVIHQVELQNGAAFKLHYSHAITYPEDGIYGSGIRQGMIEIVRPTGSLLEQTWSEEGLTGATCRAFLRAQKSKTELRRLRAF